MNHSKNKKLKILSIILAVITAIGSVTALSVFNTFASEKFTDENGISWTVVENYPGWAIRPTNNVYDYPPCVVPSEYNGKPINMIDTSAFWRKTTYATSVTLPDTIIKISDRAFEDCSTLTSVNIPDSVTTIGYAAFKGCSGLTNVTIPSGVDTINNSAFYGCSGLTSLTIQEGVTTISESAFQNCTGLTEITLPSTITTISRNAFAGCTNLTTINIPNGVTEIPDGAFSGCSNLQNITIPNSVTSIGTTAFSRCTSLSGLTIPNSVTSIGKSAFSGCTNLTAINIPNGVAEIFENTFDSCSNLTNVVIPDSVTSIGKNAFYGCSNLENIVFPNSFYKADQNPFSSTLWYKNQPNGLVYGGHVLLKAKGTISGTVTIDDSCVGINSYAFQNCTNITNVTIPEGVTAIGDYAFYGCTKLTSIIIPEGVTTIGSSAFNGCTKLTSIIIPEGVTIIDTSTFNGCSNLSNVVIPDSVKRIETYAFKNCTGLTSVTIPDSVTTIADNAFYGCANLGDVVISDDSPVNIKSFVGTLWYNSLDDGLIYKNNVLFGYKGEKPTGEIIIADGTTSISSYAFEDCTSITSVVIPDSVTSIGHAAFYGCTGLTELNIPDSVTTIGASAFTACKNLNNVHLSNKLTTISNGMFNNCKSLTNITIPNSVTAIGDNAFYNCVNLNNITIPNSVKRFGTYSFYQCSNLTAINIPNGITNIDVACFFGCSNLTDINLPNTVTKIGLEAFAVCSNLRHINFPNSLDSIGQSAFRQCSSLSEVILSNGITVVGTEAFIDCSGISSIIIPETVSSVAPRAFKNCGEIDTFNLYCGLDACSTDTFYADTFKDVILGGNTTSLDNTFKGMTSLKTMVIPETVTQIADDAFDGCTNLTIITTPKSLAHITAIAKNIPVKLIDAVSTTAKVDFEVTCDKQGYEFTVYKVADLEKTENPYEVRYNSLVPSIESAIFDGNNATMLASLDEEPVSSLGTPIGVYSTTVDGTSKQFQNLEAGIYYVRATNFPANVNWVQNSVFALPYYDSIDGWQYEIEPIPLATKVNESNPEIIKGITNSTQGNANYTDVSLGDTVDFEIKSSRVGSASTTNSRDFKLNSYVVTDVMSEGLTLNQDSFAVKLADSDDNTISTLTRDTDYVVDVNATVGQPTEFTISLTETYLKGTAFYSGNHLVIDYSAVLNEYSTRDFSGNPNEAVSLTYSNKNDVSAEIDGNTVYAYTFGIEVNKYDDAGTALAGSKFALYTTQNDAKNNTNALATGTSDATGKVQFVTTDNNIIKLQSGTYFIVETEATNGYNRYTDVIPVTISVEYSDTEVNGTYIETAPANGIQLVEVKNSKVIIPNTGGDGALYRYIIAGIALMIAVAFVVLKKKNEKKITAK